MKFLFDEKDAAYDEKGRRVGRVVAMVVLDSGGVVLLPGFAATGKRQSPNPTC